mgnify:FL=1
MAVVLYLLGFCCLATDGQGKGVSRVSFRVYLVPTGDFAIRDAKRCFFGKAGA